MLSSIKPSSSSFSTAISGSVRRSIPTKLKFSPLLIIKNCHNQSFNANVVSHQKPLHISSASNFKREVKVEAYEADRSRPLDINIELPDEQSAQKLKIGIYFATWWALNVVFNIYNKKVLNAFPYPWLTSTLSLACGSLMMLVSWATRIADAPKTDLEFWKTLFPVSN
jgi:solute carrier family 35 protein E1